MTTPASAGTTPPADIEITDDMVLATLHAIDPEFDPTDEDVFEEYPDDVDAARAALQAAAPLIGAAYLRWLTTNRAFRGVQPELVALADERDGGATR